MGYKIGPAVVRPNGNLPLYPTFDTAVNAPVFDVSRAKSGLLLVTYVQGSAKGATVYPVMRLMVGAAASSLFIAPIDDARTPVDRGAGVGLETNVRGALKEFGDALSTPQSYIVNLSGARFASFQFAEVLGGVTPGTLEAQLILDMEI